MNLELKVNRFNNEDVIATSCTKDKIIGDFGFAEIEGSKIVTVNQALRGKKVQFNDEIGVYYKNQKYIYNGGLNENLITMGEVDSNPINWKTCTNDSEYDGVYHLEGDVYVYCEDGCNSKK